MQLEFIENYNIATELRRKSKKKGIKMSEWEVHHSVLENHIQNIFLFPHSGYTRHLQKSRNDPPLAETKYEPATPTPQRQFIYKSRNIVKCVANHVRPDFRVENQSGPVGPYN